MPGIILAHADILPEGVPGDITSCNQHTGTSLHSSSCVVFAVTAFGGPRGASSVCAGYDYIPLVHRSCVATLRTNDVWLNKPQGHERIQFRGWTITDCLHKQSMPHNHSLPGGPLPGAGGIMDTHISHRSLGGPTWLPSLPRCQGNKQLLINTAGGTGGIHELGSWCFGSKEGIGWYIASSLHRRNWIEPPLHSHTGTYNSTVNYCTPLSIFPNQYALSISLYMYIQNF